jgi:hypothetical protein
LTRGLRRLLDMLVTQQLLAAYETEHDALPPRIAAWLGRQAPPLRRGATGSKPGQSHISPSTYFARTARLRGLAFSLCSLCPVW